MISREIADNEKIVTETNVLGTWPVILCGTVSFAILTDGRKPVLDKFTLDVEGKVRAPAYTQVIFRTYPDHEYVIMKTYSLTTRCLILIYL